MDERTLVPVLDDAALSAPNPFFVFDGPRPESLAEQRAASVARARALRTQLELGTGYGAAQMLRVDHRAELEALFDALVGALLEQGDSAGVFAPSQLVPAVLPAQVLAWVQLSRAGSHAASAGSQRMSIAGTDDCGSRAHDGITRALALCRGASGRLIGGYLSAELLAEQRALARKALPAAHTPEAAAYQLGTLLRDGGRAALGVVEEAVGPLGAADGLGPRERPGSPAPPSAASSAAPLPLQPSLEARGGAVTIDSAAWRRLEAQGAARASHARAQRKEAREAQLALDKAGGLEARRQQARAHALLVRARAKAFDARRRADGRSAAGAHATAVRTPPGRSFCAAAAAAERGLDAQPPAPPAGSAQWAGAEERPTARCCTVAVLGADGALLSRQVRPEGAEADLGREAGAAFVADRLERLLRNQRAHAQPPPPVGRPSGGRLQASRWAKLGRTEEALARLAAARAGSAGPLDRSLAVSEGLVAQPTAGEHAGSPPPLPPVAPCSAHRPNSAPPHHGRSRGRAAGAHVDPARPSRPAQRRPASARPRTAAAFAAADELAWWDGAVQLPVGQLHQPREPDGTAGPAPELDGYLRAAQRTARLRTGAVSAQAVGAEAERALRLADGHLRALGANLQRTPPAQRTAAAESRAAASQATGRLTGKAARAAEHSGRVTAFADAARLGRSPAEAVFGGQMRAHVGAVPAGGTNITAARFLAGRARTDAADTVARRSQGSVHGGVSGRIEPIVSALCQLPASGGEHGSVTVAALRLAHEPTLRTRSRQAAWQPGALSNGSEAPLPPPAAPPDGAKQVRATEAAAGASRTCAPSRGTPVRAAQQAGAAERAGATAARGGAALPQRSAALDWFGTPLAPL